jgi:hypothetical protein
LSCDRKNNNFRFNHQSSDWCFVPLLDLLLPRNFFICYDFLPSIDRMPMMRESHTNCAVSPCYSTSFHAQIFLFVLLLLSKKIFFFDEESKDDLSSFLHLILSRFFLYKNRLSSLVRFGFPGGDHPSSLTEVDDDDSRVAGGGAGLPERYAKDNSHDFLFSPPFFHSLKNIYV